MAIAADLRGIPLDEYTRQCPPGRRPHVRNNSLITYEETIRLWMRGQIFLATARAVWLLAG
eukprot:9205801-Pyramimonas_sp.AAC.1